MESEWFSTPSPSPLLSFNHCSFNLRRLVTATFVTATILVATVDGVAPPMSHRRWDDDGCGETLIDDGIRRIDDGMLAGRRLHYGARCGSAWSRRNNGQSKGAGDLSSDQRIRTGQKRRQDTHQTEGEDVLEKWHDRRMYKGKESLKSHSLVLRKEPMADPTQTLVGTNASATKPRKDETPASTHPYLSGVTNMDAPIITNYSDEEEAGGFRIIPEFVRTIRRRKEPAGKEPVGPAQVENDENLDSLLQPYHPTNFTDMSKFTKRIAKAPLPEKLKVPLNVVHTLTGAARLWFDSLPLGGIDIYEELRDKFLRQFNQKKKASKNPKEISIYDVGTMKKWNSSWKDSSQKACRYKGSPRKGHDLIERVKTAPYFNKGKSHTDKGRSSFSPYKPPQKPYPEKFTPLTKSPSEILATEKAKTFFQKPQPLRNASRPNPDEYCEFHKCHGHKTDDCIHLRKEIEVEVKSGKLSHLVKEIGATTSKGKEPARGEETEKRRSYVDMIRRYPNEGNRDNKRAKTFEDEPPPWLECSITFPPLKHWEVQEAPLNITMDIAIH
ncbi:hypothetical protein E3N88_10557 [Mikania micrantha]|uniref:Retrotransposon gag domain-containing protein n=1 Tax=Mikania micrantha TaxID=192012 RepID=A0A5N6PDU3_9ASTR|nr:hypothetical protein E3N88_10536 [Mikania micrantha]KAD6119286.1 hypothetical protein E3N88_10557 [Mikania micrantha]